MCIGRYDLQVGLSRCWCLSTGNLFVIGVSKGFQTSMSRQLSASCALHRTVEGPAFVAQSSGFCTPGKREFRAVYACITCMLLPLADLHMHACSAKQLSACRVATTMLT